MRCLSIVLLMLATCGSPSGATAQDPAPPPPELKRLDAMVGTWDEVVTSKPSESTPKATRSTSTTKKTWSMGGRFLRMEGTWAPGETEFSSLLTYDPVTKEFRTWYFDSAGTFPRSVMRGGWDQKSRTITWNSFDEFGNRTVGKTKIVDNDTHEWSVVTTDPSGKVLVDLEAKNTRRGP